MCFNINYHFEYRFFVSMNYFLYFCFIAFNQRIEIKFIWIILYLYDYKDIRYRNIMFLQNNNYISEISFIKSYFLPQKISLKVWQKLVSLKKYLNKHQISTGFYLFLLRELIILLFTKSRKVLLMTTVVQNMCKIIF